MKYVWGTLMAVLGLVILVFSVQNLASIDVAFLSWSLSMPKAVVVLGSYLLGVITGSALFALLSAYFKAA